MSFDAGFEYMTIPDVVKRLNEGPGKKYGIKFNRVTIWRKVKEGSIPSCEIAGTRYIDGRAYVAHVTELLDAVAAKTAELISKGVTE